MIQLKQLQRSIDTMYQIFSQLCMFICKIIHNMENLPHLAQLLFSRNWLCLSPHGTEVKNNNLKIFLINEITYKETIVKINLSPSY